MKDVTPWQFKSFQDIQDGQGFIARHKKIKILCMRAFMKTGHEIKDSLVLVLHHYSMPQKPVCLAPAESFKKVFVAVYPDAEIDFGIDADSVDLENRVDVKNGVALRYEDRSVILVEHLESRLFEVDVVTGEVLPLDIDTPHATSFHWTIRISEGKSYQKGPALFTYPPEPTVT